MAARMVTTWLRTGEKSMQRLDSVLLHWPKQSDSCSRSPTHKTFMPQTRGDPIQQHQRQVLSYASPSTGWPHYFFSLLTTYHTPPGLARGRQAVKQPRKKGTPPKKRSYHFAIQAAAGFNKGTPPPPPSLKHWCKAMAPFSVPGILVLLLPHEGSTGCHRSKALVF